MRIALLLALFALAGARSIHKRNTYGDEPIAPVESSTVLAEDPVPEIVAVPAPAPVEPVAEIPQEESGYRAKRGVQNSYGDEPAPAVEEVEQHVEQPEEPVEQPEEQPAPEVVPEPAPAPVEPVAEVPQEDSGYRAKRGVQNSYGDEPAPAVEEVEQHVEQPEEPVEQPEEQPAPEVVPEPAPAPVEPVAEVPQEDSGYRAKRGVQNSYGDEPAPAVEEVEQHVEQPEEPVEQPEEQPAPEVVPEPAPAPVEPVAEVPQEDSGYRAKRGVQNSYGDEPAPVVQEDEKHVEQPEEPVEQPEEQPILTEDPVPEIVAVPAPAPVEPVAEIPQEESGYRAKRGVQNSYGDEPAPAVEEVEQHVEQPEEPVEQPEEQPILTEDPVPEVVPEPAPAPVEPVAEVPQEESGYRAKRGVQNSYGDEPAPVVQEDEKHVEQPEEPVEQPEEQPVPEVVPEAAPAPVEPVAEVPQEDSGYRAKRGVQNSYGDEPAPVVQEDEKHVDQPEEPVEQPEEQPVLTEDPVPEIVAVPAPAPVEPVAEIPQEESGYRAKRGVQNSYGDEPAPVVEEVEKHVEQPEEPVEQPEVPVEQPEEQPEPEVVPEPAPAPVEPVAEVPQEESGYKA